MHHGELQGIWCAEFLLVGFVKDFEKQTVYASVDAGGVAVGFRLRNCHLFGSMWVRI